MKDYKAEIEKELNRFTDLLPTNLSIIQIQARKIFWLMEELIEARQDIEKAYEKGYVDCSNGKRFNSNLNKDL